MTLTLLLLIFIFIAFFSALTIILVTVKGEFSKRPYLQSIIVYILFLQIGSYIYQPFMRYFPKN